MAVITLFASGVWRPFLFLYYLWTIKLTAFKNDIHLPPSGDILTDYETDTPTLHFHRTGRTSAGCVRAGKPLAAQPGLHHGRPVPG